MKLIREKDQKIWVTSDFHYNHTNIIKYSNLMFKTIDEMNEIIIKNHNAHVNENDIWFHIGDLCFGNNKKTNSIQLLSKLNGRKYILWGNHDYKIHKSELGVEWVGDYLELSTTVRDFETSQNIKMLFVMFHYPIVQWNCKHHGSIHLHAHCHGTLDYQKVGLDDSRILDVCISKNCFYPYNLDDIYNSMKTKGINKLDHHDEKTT
jgi:calcineurin-like phosphoesterase family protein